MHPMCRWMLKFYRLDVVHRGLRWHAAKDVPAATLVSWLTWMPALTSRGTLSEYSVTFPLE